MLGVILGVSHEGWQTWSLTDIGVSEEEFPSYVYRNTGMLIEPVAQLEPVAVEAPKHNTIGELIKEHEGVRGIQFSTDEHGNVQAAYIRGKHGGMKLVSMGDGLENVSSKIWEEKVWRKKYGSINVFIRNNNRCWFGNWFVVRSQVCGP